MTKSELIAQIADQADLPKNKAAAMLDALSGSISEALARGEKVSWSGMGTFESTQRSARTGRNPQTGAAIEIPSSTGVRFKAAKALKDALK